jgi:hypothetical protein
MNTSRSLLLVGALAANQAQAAQVQRTPFQIRREDTISKTVSVLSARQNGYTVNTQLSYKQLSAMRTEKMPATGYVLGLTRTESRVQIGLDGPMLTDPVSGYECVAPRIKVQLTYAPVRIYVGNEYECVHGPPGQGGGNRAERTGAALRGQALIRSGRHCALGAGARDRQRLAAVYQG